MSSWEGQPGRVTLGVVVDELGVMGLHGALSRRRSPHPPRDIKNESRSSSTAPAPPLPVDSNSQTLARTTFVSKTTAGLDAWRSSTRGSTVPDIQYELRSKSPGLRVCSCETAKGPSTRRRTIPGRDTPRRAEDAIDPGIHVGRRAELGIWGRRR